MKILFFGSDDFSIPSLKLLAASQHKIAAVIAQPDKPAGRGQKVSPCPAAQVATELGLKLMQPEKIQTDEAIQQLLALKADLLVVVAYGKFLPHKLIHLTPFHAINVHPSLLPKYRGASPIQTAILNGDKKTGVTTMMITEVMDAGDIFLQVETDIDAAENAMALHDRLATLGAHLLLKTVDGLEKKILKAKQQNASKVVNTSKLKKEDGHLDWRESAFALYNRVRALTPWPGTFCYLHGKMLKIFEAAPLANDADQKPGTVTNNEQGIMVACGQGTLCLLEVQLEGKKRMGAAEFLKGHPVAIGTKLE